MSNETTPELTAILAEHRPVVGRFATLKAVVGCSCMDRVFIARRESYPDHLAGQITAAGFGDVRAAEAERELAGEFTADDRDHWQARAESAEAALAGLVAKVKDAASCNGGRHYYGIDAVCRKCEMPSWIEAHIRQALPTPDTAGDS